MDEFERIARYFAPLARSPGAHGLSDDVATLGDGNGQTIITTDCLVEGVHFLPDDPVDSLARKLVRVNVSDVIAKGAQPDEALLTLGWPSGRSEAEMSAFAVALGAELEAWRASLIGGDSVSAPDALFLSLTLTGRCLSPLGPVLRSGAKIGDDIWVTGQIGWGAIGLEAARRGNDPDDIARYREPVLAPLSGAHLVSTNATACMDVSDGLVGDLAKLCDASEVGADLHLDAVRYARRPRDREDAIAMATGGDDYQILMTSPPERRSAIERWMDDTDWPVTRIGTIRKGTGPMLYYAGESVPLPAHLSFAHG